VNKRNVLVNFRLTEAELFTLNSKVKRTNLSREEFIRESVFNQIIHEIPSADYQKFIFELRRVGQNLNRLLQIAYSNGFLDVASINYCLDEIRSLNRNINKEFFGEKIEVINGNDKH